LQLDTKVAMTRIKYGC